MLGEDEEREVVSGRFDATCAARTQASHLLRFNSMTLSHPFFSGKSVRDAP